MVATAPALSRFSVNELRGMISEGCQGYSEANAALAELARRAALRQMVGVLEAVAKQHPGELWLGTEYHDARDIVTRSSV